MQTIGLLGLLWTTAVAAPTGNEEIDQWIHAERQGRHLTASAGLYGILREGNYPEQDDVVNYHLAQALMSMGMEHSAQNHLMETVRRGPKGENFRIAVTKLITLAERNDSNAELLRFVDKIDAGIFPRKAQDHIYYLQGLKHLDDDELTAATHSFDKVRKTSAVASRAIYHTGVIHNETGRLNKAVRAFKEVSTRPLRVHHREDDAALQSLAVMAMARIHFGVDQYETAQKLYAKVPQESVYWPESMFELAWANYRDPSPDLPRTLGILLALESPHFSDEYLPEAPLLRSLSLYSLCYWDEVDEVLDTYTDEWAEVIGDIDGLMSDYPPDQRKLLADQFYDDVMVSGKLGDQPQLLRRILRNKDLNGRVKTLNRLDAEIASIETQKQLWQVEVGNALIDQIQQDRIRHKRAAGKILMKQLLAQRGNLERLVGEAAIIRFESVDNQREGLDRRITHPDVPPFEATTIDHAVNNELVNWPFNGEFWWDELPYYRYVLPPVCGLNGDV